MKTVYAGLSDATYSMAYDSENRITFSDGRLSANIPIENSTEYVYKAGKTYVCAIDGASGLFNACRRAFDSDCGAVLYTRLIKHVLTMSRCRSGRLIKG